MNRKIRRVKGLCIKFDYFQGEDRLILRVYTKRICKGRAFTSFLQRVRKLTAAIWTREERERVGARETEKVIKEIMDGSLRELQRTNSHFQFAAGKGAGESGRRERGVKAKPFYRLDPCRPSIGFRVFSTAEEFHFKSFPSKRLLRGDLRLYSKEAISWQNETTRARSIVLINT